MPSLSPNQIRSIFGDNLRLLTAESASVSQVCRDLGINRTQFNRYLGGESFPRPDILAKICDHFGVDGRILLEPLKDIEAKGRFNWEEMPAIFRAMISFREKSGVRLSIENGNYVLFRPNPFQRGYLFGQILSLSFKEPGEVDLKGYMPVVTAQAFGHGRAPHKRRMLGNLSYQPGGLLLAMTLEHAPTWVLGMLTRSYLGNPNFMNGQAVGTQDPTKGFPLMIQRLPEGHNALMRARKWHGSFPKSDVPGVVDDYFTTAGY